MDRPFIFFDPTVIRAIRKAKKLTLTEVGRRMDVSGQTISGWENGETRIPASELAILSNVLNVEPNIFFKKRMITNAK